MNQAQALALTLACETPLACWWLREHPLARTAFAAMAASALTHPAAWHLASRLSPSQYRAGLWWIEAAVVLVEAVVFRLVLRLAWPRALAVSLAANALSMAVGWWWLR